MNKRMLTLLIAAALGATAGVAIAVPQDTTSRHLTEPPSAAADAAERERQRLAEERDDMADEADRLAGYDESATDDTPPLADADSADLRQARTQSPPNDPSASATPSGIKDDRIVVDRRDEVQEATVAVDDAEPSSGSEQMGDDYREQPIAGGGTGNSGSAGGDIESSAFAATAGSEGFSTGATAQQAADRFAGMDDDDSGELSKDELGERDAVLADHFDAYDINGDGSIAGNEYQSYLAAQHWLEGMDESERQLASRVDDGMSADDDMMEGNDGTAATDRDPAAGTMLDDGRATVGVEDDGVDTGMDMDMDSMDRDTDSEAAVDADEIDTDVDSGESLLEDDNSDSDQR